MNKKNKIILNSFKKSLIASCQPVPRGPLDKPSFVLASAKASIIGGAKALRIEGFKNLQLINEKEILEKINLKDSNLLNLNLENLKEQLMTINEIETLSIEKKINGDLNILVQEKKPFVFWEVDGRRFLIDTKGIILNYKNYQNNDLKIVTGESANLHATTIINKINLFPRLNFKFQSADYINNYRWDINLSNNVKVKLPFEDHENIALNFLDKLVKNENFESLEQKVIDLRVIGKAFVK